MNSDNHIDYEGIIEILEDILGEYKSHNENKGQISFSCPICSYDIKGLDELDGKGNLEVNYIYGVYKCWVCSDTHDTHGSIYKLIKKHGTQKQIKKYELLKPEEQGIVSKTYKQVKLPKEFISLKNASNGIKLTPQYKQAMNYLKRRNVTDEIISKYNIGFCPSGMYENRIIIPSYDVYENLNYFIARSFLSKSFMKYKNPEAQKEIIIWNEYLINWFEPIYLVEGAFDSIFLKNSIAMLGKHLSDVLYKKLYEKAFKIIIALDGDAYEDAEKLYHKLNCGKLMGRVWIIKLPVDKDIADMAGDISKYEPKQID